MKRPTEDHEILQWCDTAAERGRWVVIVGSLVGGRLQLRMKMENFPLAALPNVTKQTRETIERFLNERKVGAKGPEVSAESKEAVEAALRRATKPPIPPWDGPTPETPTAPDPAPKRRPEPLSPIFNAKGS